MTKEQLQKESKEKLKLGIKPSDLKKPRVKNSFDEGYESDSSVKTTQTKTPLKKDQISQLQSQVKFEANKAQNYLTELQSTLAELDQAQEEIAQLQSQPSQLSKETEQAITEANQKIRQQEQTIKELQAKNKELNKSMTDLQNQAKNKAETNPKETQLKTLSKTAKPKPQLTNFSCPICRVKTQTPIWIKVAQNDLEFNLLKGQVYPFCSQCSPKIKEFNEYDLITPELWEKYPYSDAKEILELEFGIQPKDKEAKE